MQHAITEGTTQQLGKTKSIQIRQTGAFSSALPVTRTDFKKYVATLKRRSPKAAKEHWSSFEFGSHHLELGVEWRKVGSKNRGYLTYRCDIHCHETGLAMMWVRLKPDQNDRVCTIYIDCLPDFIGALSVSLATTRNESGKLKLFKQYASHPGVVLSSIAGPGADNYCFSSASLVAISAAEKKPSLIWEKGDWTLPECTGNGVW